MFLTGFADEASRDLKEQIRATEELGWKFIETRFIGNKNLGTISDAEFEDVLEILSQTDVRFNCYGSNIANWGKSPRSDADFEASRKELLTAIPRMHKLGIKMVRGMSFKRATEETFDNPDLEKVIFAKIRELVRICESEGIIYGHENCMNYGGQSWHHTLRLLDNINSDNFKLIFDTGNPTFNFSRLGPKPYSFRAVGNSIPTCVNSSPTFISKTRIAKCWKTARSNRFTAGRATDRAMWSGLSRT